MRARPLVLVVDGHDDTREMYIEGLCSLGFEASGADGAAHAYALARESLPDVIVTELSLPHSDGWDLLRRVKNDGHTRDIPVVVLTCYSEPQSLERTRREGGAAFILKPCSPEDLASRLRRLVFEG